jgi:hypothetical protein
MVSQPTTTAVRSPLPAPEILDVWEASARVAELEAEIAQLKEALARRQLIGVATGLLAQRFSISPDRAWSLLVRDIAEALIKAHCGLSGPPENKIIRAIESYLPDGVRLIGPEGDGLQPSPKPK